MVPKIEPKTKVGTWVLRYRFAIVLFMFFIIVPIIAITVFYVNTYNQHKGVIFSGDEVITEFTQMGFDIDSGDSQHELFVLSHGNVTLYLKLIEYTLPQYEGDTTAYYRFSAMYSTKTVMDITSISVTIVLKADWTDLKSTSARTISYITKEWTSSYTDVYFPHVLPVTPLWFVTVSEPSLYAKLSYTYNTGFGSTSTQEAYFKGRISSVTPSSVIDARSE